MTVPSQAAYLYLLVFPEKKVVKVGKANDILNRLATLKRWWGEPDYDASYCVKAEESLVFRLERALHCFLDEFDSPEDSGDGHTELFRMEALPIALRHLELYISNKKPGSYELTKGIPRALAMPKQNSKYDLRAYERFSKRGRLALDSLDDTLRQLRYLHRWVALLLRWQHKIQYQWDVTDDIIFFRARSKQLHLMYSKVLWPALSYHVSGFQGGFHGVNLCSFCSSGDVNQFEISTKLLPDGERRPDVLELLLAQAVQWINVLPRRSAAAFEEIPRLNISLHDFFEKQDA
ncbi:GIY-YIG nuclease family protein [Pusillimonas sp. CC-YST705]|uniref:GIY-YIG nuclease family protein n=1 Tax=Mesopusillimonas faecipullorum TaxID=2755040 RepID=A0ABS8C8N8_9BURK|nr:GIY-YIG nuclease family protein [Mesopusillimonas faecipullorum]MCB5362382.1 GIY-YIG nuclease family protein [Mesopusillimonas faecipullorum]